jgi:signal transduction histidine kinase
MTAESTNDADAIRARTDELLKQSREIYRSSPKDAIKLAEEALGLSESIDYTEGKVTALFTQGDSYNILSDYITAIEKLNQSLSYLPGGNLPRKAKILRSLGSVYYNKGSYEEALEYTLKSLEIIRSNNDRLGEAYCLNNIGTIYRNMENLELALEYYFQSIVIKEELGDERSIYNTYSNIAVVYSTLDDFRTARDFLYKGLHLMRKYNDKNAESHALNSLGLCYKDEGDLEKGLKYCAKARDLAQKIGNRQSECHAVVNIGLMYTEWKYYNEAIPHLKAGYELALEVGDKGGIANSLSHLGIAYSRLGEPEKGIREIENGLKAASDINSLQLMARAAKEIALIYEQMDDYKNASEFWKKCKDWEEKYLRDVIRSKTKALLVQYDVEKHRKEAELSREKNEELLSLVKKLDKINEEKNNFIGIISHDIRDPISSIYSLSDFIVNDIEDLSKGELLDFSKDIKYSADKVIKLLQALLDINAIETGRYNFKPERVDLTSLLQSIMINFSERALSKDINIRMEPAEKHYAYCDKNSAEQIFSNLISNAVKYSPRGKTISMGISNDDGFVRTFIQDEGPGFKEEDKRMMFEKFAKLSARPTGGETSTGLGLSIVKQLVEMNKGRVECISEYMKGARFTIYLPRDTSV